MNILIAGGTGFIGKALAHKLANEKHKITILTRKRDLASTNGNIDYLHWDNLRASSTSEFDIVINLSGERVVGRRWNTEVKSALKASRIDSTQALVQYIQSCDLKPRLFLNASAVGYYGSRNDEELDETSSAGKGFLSQMCLSWEAEAKKAIALGVRVIFLRIGVVLDKQGGALEKIKTPFDLYCGGPLGTGSQWMPWIHRDDIVSAIQFLIKTPNTSGPYNLTSPNPSQMKDFCKTLGEVMKKPSWLPVPGFALKLIMGEMSEVVLGSQRVLPKRLIEEGFSFQYPTLDKALSHIVKGDQNE